MGQKRDRARGYGLKFPSPPLLAPGIGGIAGTGLAREPGGEIALAAPNRFSARTATIDGAGYSLRRNLR